MGPSPHYQTRSTPPIAGPNLGFVELTNANMAVHSGLCPILFTASPEAFMEDIDGI